MVQAEGVTELVQQGDGADRRAGIERSRGDDTRFVGALIADVGGHHDVGGDDVFLFPRERAAIKLRHGEADPFVDVRTFG